MQFKIKILLLAMLLGNGFVGIAQNYFKLEGEIVDSESNKIPDAIIQYGSEFLSSDNNGAFELIHHGVFVLHILALGYEIYSDTIELNTDIEVVYILQKLIMNLDQVIIEGESNKKENSTYLNKINSQEIKQTPSATGIPDLYSFIKTKPGVQSNTEGQKGLIIRGGNYDQSTTYIDGIPIVGSSHLFGLLSMFQTECIDNIKLFNGYKPVNYGATLGPAIEINLKEKYSKNLSTAGSLSSSVISSQIQSVVSDKNFFFQVGLRKSNLFLIQDLINSTINTKDSRVITPEYQFSDVIIKSSYFFKNQNIQLLHIRSSDDIVYDVEFTSNEREYLNSMSWNNVGSSINWKCYTENSNIIKADFIHTKFNSNVHSTNTIPYWDSDNNESIWRSSVSEFDNSIETIKSSASLETSINEYLNINSGIQYKRSMVEPNSYEIWKDEGIPDETSFGENRIVNTGSFYLESIGKVTQNSDYKIGFRTSVFMYDENSEIHINPRFSYSHRLNDRLTLNLYSIRSSQDVHLITLNSFGFIPEIWIAPSEINSIQRSWSTGLKVDYSAESTKMYFEAYLRGMSNLLEFKEDIDFSSTTTNIVRESIANNGEGAVLGLEFYLKSSYKNFNYNLSYSFAKSSRLFNNLNQGNVFPFAFDIRHDASLILSYEISNKISASALYTFSTGRALNINDQVIPVGFSIPLGGAYTRWVSYSQPQNRNGYRIGNINRLDFNVSWNTITNYGLLKIQFGVYNTLNNLNPYSAIITNDDNGELVIEEIGLIPLMPNINISFSWN